MKKKMIHGRNQLKTLTHTNSLGSLCLRFLYISTITTIFTFFTCFLSQYPKPTTKLVVHTLISISTCKLNLFFHYLFHCLLLLLILPIPFKDGTLYAYITHKLGILSSSFKIFNFLLTITPFVGFQY